MYRHNFRNVDRVESSDGLLFPTRADSITQAFSRAVKRIAGQESLRFHDTRHERISRLYEQGYTVVEVARISGHKTLTQLDRYTHLDVQHLIKKMQELKDAA